MIKREIGEISTFDTRADAYSSVNRKLRYEQILECLREKPMTAKEIAATLHEKGLTPTSERNFSSPRLTELSQQGLVEPIGKVKCKYTGKLVSVYSLRNNQ